MPTPLAPPSCSVTVISFNNNVKTVIAWIHVALFDILFLRVFFLLSFWRTNDHLVMNHGEKLMYEKLPLASTSLIAACGHPPVSTARILSSGNASFLTRNSQSSLKINQTLL